MREEVETFRNAALDLVRIFKKSTQLSQIEQEEIGSVIGKVRKELDLWRKRKEIEGSK
jgi:hypothetical protein